MHKYSGMFIVLSIVTHIANTARAEAWQRQASVRAVKQARPKAALACNNYTVYKMNTEHVTLHVEELS